jgi:IS5 family transposase
MKAKPKGPEQDDLFRARLVEIIDMRHELVKLAAFKSTVALEVGI